MDVFRVLSGFRVVGVVHYTGYTPPWAGVGALSVPFMRRVVSRWARR